MERYNPLAAGHIESAGKLNGAQLWRISGRGESHRSSVEVELTRQGYVRILVGDKECWIFDHWEGDNEPYVETETCLHEPDLATLSLPQDIHPTTVDDGRIEFIIDVVCGKCGRSGSFAVTVQPSDINW